MAINTAFLWDESFLWGLMAYKALKANGLPFELVRSTDIRDGCLKNYQMLFVPGGWASNKLKALGEEGIKEIKRFVNHGGNYLGFCGGAGLATQDGIGLLNINRMPTRQRVPSFSGRIHLNINEHPVWKGFKIQDSRFKIHIEKLKTQNSKLQPPNSELIFHAWWPSQFLIDDKNIKVLATYGDALPDSFSSDLNIGDMEANGGWLEMEEIYKINLNPKRLKNEPAVIEGAFGKGRVILSLIHFDTPDDENGANVLKNLWEYLAGQKSEVRSQKSEEPRVRGFKDSSEKVNHSLEPSGHGPLESYKSPDTGSINEIELTISELINLGMRNFLWFWRNPMLLQWRRGVRGLEYCTLYVMIKEIAEEVRSKKSEARSQNIDKDLIEVRKLLIPFVEKSKQLLILERYALQNGYITYEKCDDPKIQRIRTELFGNSKSHGGLFKKLIDEVDSLLYALLIEASK